MKFLLTVLTVLTIGAACLAQSPPPLRITDGTVSKTNATRLVFPSGSLTVNGGTVTFTGGAGSGTVTTVSVVTNAGISGSVANATSTPAITLSLGQINPLGVEMVGTAGAAHVYFPAQASINTVTSAGFALTSDSTNRPVWATNGKSDVTFDFLGVTGARVVTFPDASITVARTDAAQTFTGVQGLTSPAVTTSLTTPSTTFALLNTTATTVNFAGAATTLNIGAAATTILNFGGSTTAAEFRFLEPSGSGTNYSAFKAVAQGSNITYSWPPTVGAAGTVLTDVAGNGVLTWAAGGSGATTALDNLAAVAINTDLLPASTQSLGSATKPFLSSFTGNTTQYESVAQAAGVITHSALGSATNISIALTPKGTGGVVVTSAAAAAFEVGPNGSTNPTLRAVSNVASAATGIKVTGNAAGGAVNIDAISSAADENLYIAPKGTGFLRLTGGGTAQVVISGNGFYPLTNNSVDLGFAGGTFSWKSLQVNGRVGFETGGAISTALLANAANVLEVNAGAPGTLGFLLAGRVVTAKTSDFTVTTAGKSTLFTNSGAGAGVNFTLPTAAVGLQYGFCRDANQTVTVTAGASTVIRSGASVTASAGNVTLDAVGSCIQITAISTTQWFATVTGTVTFN